MYTRNFPQEFISAHVTSPFLYLPRSTRQFPEDIQARSTETFKPHNPSTSHPHDPHDNLKHVGQTLIRHTCPTLPN